MSSKLHELRDVILNTHEESARVWCDTLDEDQKHQLTTIFLLLAARLSFHSAPALRRAFRAAEKFGAHFLPVGFYSPIPSLDEIDNRVYERRYDRLPGLTLNRTNHSAWLQRLGRYSREIARFPHDIPVDGTKFYWSNPAFGPGDAAVYYTLIREIRPKRIIEIGAGYSSLIALEALAENREGSLTCVEPYPNEPLREVARIGKIKLIETRVQDVPIELFEQLMENDILFIDSSHVSKIGSDVNHEVFEILPRLNIGVFCHFHDIFFPWDVARKWIEDLNIFWNEQYLLMAFLACNPNFSIELSNQFVARELAEEFLDCFPDFPMAAHAPGGGSLWFRVLQKTPFTAMPDEVIDDTVAPQPPVSRQQLREQIHQLTNDGKCRAALKLLAGIDLDAERDAHLLYHAGVCLAAVGNNDERAINLVKRAANEGFAARWCAYNLGLLEKKRGRAGAAAYYFTVARLADPAGQDLDDLLQSVAPTVHLSAVQAAKDGQGCSFSALALGERELHLGNLSAAVFYLTISVFLDPASPKSRALLLETAPDVFLGFLPLASESSHFRTTSHLDPEIEEAIRDKEFPIYLTQHGPALWPVADPSIGPPAIVLSVPKSGTYFIEALYKRMGYSAVHVHAMDGNCVDLRFEGADPHNRKATSNKPVPITILSRLVLPGQIIVSHCSHNASIEAALGGFKKIYLYRDLREIFVSKTREESSEAIPREELATRVAQFCQTQGEGIKNMIEAVSGWRNNKHVVAIDFADLTSTNPKRREEVAERLEAFMGWSKASIIAALERVPDDDTATKSVGGRSTVDGAWDQQCEAWFREHMAGIRVVPD